MLICSLLFQLKELEEEFAKLPGKAPKQQRFLKSQQDLKAKAAAQDEEGGEEDGKGQRLCSHSQTRKFVWLYVQLWYKASLTNLQSTAQWVLRLLAMFTH